MKGLSCLLILLLSLTAVSCSDSGQPEEDRVYLDRMNRYCREGIFDSLFLYSSEIFRQREDRTGYLEITAALYAAQSAVSLERFADADYYLNEVERMVSEDTPANLLGMWKGIQSSYVMKVSLNYPLALSCLNEAKQYYEQEEDWLNVCTTLCNTAFMYYVRKDTAGISLAWEAYELSRKHPEDPYLQSLSMYTLSSMFLLKGEVDRAEMMASRALDIARENGHDLFLPRLYLVLGEVAFRKGDTDLAECYFQQGMECTEHTDPGFYLDLTVSYGNLLIAESRYAEAERLLEDALVLSDRTNNKKYGYQILRLVSDLYERQGDIPKAFVYFKRFYAAQDSVLNVNKEKEFNQLLLKYEKASYENIIRRKEANTYAVVSVLAVISLAAGMVFLLYRRKNRLYLELAERYRQYQQSKDLIRQYHAARGETPGGEEAQADEELFRRLEVLMRQERIYRQNDISLDKVAAILGTNRTYVSRIINRYAEKTFYGYLNMYRIEEATKILGDPKSDIPLKVLYEQVGYNSLTAFYRVFQKEVGCPPSKYREQVQRMGRMDEPADPEDPESVR